MATTTVQPLPYPLPGDPADGPAQIKALAEAVEGRVVMRFPSIAARDAALPSGTLVDGMLCHIAADNSVYARAGGQWRLMWSESSTSATPASGWATALVIDRIGRQCYPVGGISRPTGGTAATLTTALTPVGQLPPGTYPRTQIRMLVVVSGGTDQIEVIITAVGLIQARARTGSVTINVGSIWNLDGYSWVTG